MAAARSGLIDFARTALAPRNRGLLLDLAAFLAGLVMGRLLAAGASNLVRAAHDDAHAKLAIGLFFAALIVIQPVGPVLKRWSFHQRQAAAGDDGPGCFIFWYMFAYLAMMLALCGVAVTVLGEIFFPGSEAAVALIFPGFAWSIISVVLVYRYFVRPRKAPRWTFLTTPAAARLGDASLVLNAIGLQILWGSVTASAMFRELVTGTPLGRPGSFTDVLGRVVAIAACAVLLYLPARIYYLADDRHRGRTWALIVVANLPLILGAAFAPPFHAHVP